MDFNLNLKIMEEQCRICLQKGDINIWNSKVTLKTDEADMYSKNMSDSVEKTFFELMDVFTNQQELLILTDQFPYICWQCLDDLKFCCIMYEKIKLANIQLNNLYEESLNECIDEEHLIEYEEEPIQQDTEQINNFDQTKWKEETIFINLANECQEQPSLEEQHVNENVLHLNRSKHISLDVNDAFVVTQFVPTTLETSDNNFKQQLNSEDGQSCPAVQQMLTMNLKAVQVKNLNNLETTPNLDCDNLQSAIYICQYCPQAFSKSDYLKTHIQKSHVCKFCCQAFSLTEDLFRHIREVHTEHKCAICQKILSSHTNLRHHIRRVHRINLPAKVTLIDFIKYSDQNDEQSDSNLEMVQGETELSNMEPNLQYIWKNEDNLDILNESIAK